jgi:hypothetical protein
LLAPRAFANGRYPAASNLVLVPGGADAPSGHPLVMAIETTFGIVSSRDGGATWQLACEPAIGFMTEWNAALVLAANGTAVTGLPDGLVTAPAPYCTFSRPNGAPEQGVLDLTVDALGRRMVAAAVSHGFALSDDDGVTWRRIWGSDAFLVSTIDVAPGHPDRLYASGYLDTTSVLLRSDDGGTTFNETTRDFLGGTAPYIAAVSPIDPDLLYLRVDLTSGGTMLARSTDGGRSLHELVRTDNPMTGVAVTPDGQTLWAGSSGSGAHDGLFRSSDAGATWLRVNDRITPLCLRYHGTFLYACADDAGDGFGLGFSRDGGEHFSPLVTWSQLQGPEACPADSPGRTLCQGDWPQLRGTLVPAGDGGVADAAASDVAVTDTSANDARLTSGDAGGCSCGIASRPRENEPPMIVLLALAVAARRNWRHR